MTETQPRSVLIVGIDVSRRYTNVVVIYTAMYSLNRDFIVSASVRGSRRDKFARSELPG